MNRLSSLQNLKKSEEMLHAPAEAEKNIKNAVCRLILKKIL